MFRSATFKLTLYYLLIIAVISLGFSAAFYQVAANDLAHGLQRQSRLITDHFPVFSHSPYLFAPDELRTARNHLLARLVVMNLAVLTVAGFASYALARRTLEPIAAAHERQKRFTADVSHELRTPLTAIKMESEVALLDPKAPAAELRQTLGSNIEEAEKLTGLISTLLRLSQLDDAQQVPLTDRVAINTSLATATAQLQAVATARNITVTSNKASKAVALGDQSTLTQLFVILLDNAIKYSPDGSTIDLSTDVRDGLISVAIRDHGSGIAKADLAHVFDRFYRADAARTSGGGFGLGLSIAQLIADSHGATITLSSKLGGGTTARVTIPQAPAVPAPAPKTSPA